MTEAGDRAKETVVDDEPPENFPDHRRGRRWLGCLGVVLLVGLVALAVGGVWLLRQINPSGPAGAPVSIDVAPGSSTSRIAGLLDDKGVVRSARVFRLYAKMTSAGPWQAGRYTFRHHAHLAAVVRALDAGPELTFERLTIPEGLTLAQVADRVGRLPGRSSATFLDLARSGAVHSKYQPPGSNNLEGLVFPDTYVIDAAKDDEKRILTRLVGAFDGLADQLGLGPASARVGVTPYQAVTVASMIEREARVPDERGKVARVVYNRLAKGIRLGIDATIRYELDKPSGPLRRSELARDTPYNTRTRAGLPPTPIASPGRASLEAALAPTPGPWLYYVIADAQGHHAFVATDAEFQRAKAAARAKGLL